MSGGTVTADRGKHQSAIGTSEPARAGPAAAWEIEHIARARCDPAAFAPLYEAYVEFVWRYALSRLGDRERAADATSQTFAQAIAALPTFRPERRGDGTTFRSWLMTIARNVVIDEARKARPTTPLDAEAAQPWLVDRERSPEESAIAAVERQRIKQALAHLPDTQRQIVELRAVGMKGAEIAGVLNMSVAAVKTANHRAHLRLRELLGERSPGQDMNS
ncbi:MAG: RNA polymerase sigma factor [Thermomicrobiales bacterium]